MKQVSVILLMLMFTVSQYATQFNYLECKLANTFSTATIKCDCETELKNVRATDKDLPASKSHVHHYVDDLFTGNNLMPVHDFPENISTSVFSSITTRTLNGHGDDPYKPPRG
ncbi:hypothetical protein [Ferruginibacter sp. HRS2-29]|uniref:hypothetical protein n=1 Tax=Ferruginibacter sp. HRS2-29 TaxID=2487334 RepID=UPI0020CE6409|nr:hypothetical protein [Ferruginibacter sp. HRS2-29]MCP9751832.1 hypothetical protein [Ferruginibacter sp. HRS2-29]